MTAIEAVYLNGVFKPLEEVDLPNNARVRLQVEPAIRQDLLDWLEDTRKLREESFKKYGMFPDSAPDIAEDRMRDV